MISATVLSAVVIVMSAEPDGVRFTWDSDTLFGFINALDFRSLYDAKLSAFHSHISFAYAQILVIFKLITGDIRLSYFILNALCIVAASFGMIFLLRQLVTGKKAYLYVMAGSLFLLSPWVCGLSTYHMYDYYIWCLFPLLMYFCCKENWTGFLAVGILITFSKATGLIVFGSVCFGIVITSVLADIRERKIHSVNRLFLRLITDIRYWYFLTIALIFFVIFKTGIDEGTQFEDTRFEFNLSHIVHILKIYLTANYLWIFTILTLAMIISAYLRKSILTDVGAKKNVSVILVSELVFLTFNCLCVTYRLPRYMDSHIAVVYICASVMLLSLEYGYLAEIIIFIICAVNLTGSFCMTDPVSIALFNKINVGKRNIIDFEMTDSPSLEDSIICNREYYSYEVLLGNALTYVMTDKSAEDVMLFSLGDQNITWGLSGGRYSYNYYENKKYFELYYDTKIKGLANGYPGDNRNDPDKIPFEMRYIFPQENLEEALPGNSGHTFYYIYMPTLNSLRERQIYDNYDVIDEKSFEYRGWEMNCIKFRFIERSCQ